MALTCLLGPSDDHIKSPNLDTGKVVNLHKFKMAAAQSLSLQITFFWLLLDPINVLQTTFLALSCLLGPSDEHIKKSPTFGHRESG